MWIEQCYTTGKPNWFQIEERIFTLWTYTGVLFLLRAEKMLAAEMARGIAIFPLSLPQCRCHNLPLFLISAILKLKPGTPLIIDHFIRSYYDVYCIIVFILFEQVSCLTNPYDSENIVNSGKCHPEYKGKNCLTRK